jgi:hypothetical protein
MTSRFSIFGNSSTGRHTARTATIAHKRFELLALSEIPAHALPNLNMHVDSNSRHEDKVHTNFLPDHLRLPYADL